MGKLYIPITGTNESRKAIHKGILLAKKFGLEPVAISVINRELLTKLERYKIFIEEESGVFTDSMAHSVEKNLLLAKKTGEEEGVVVQTVLLTGDPFKQFFDFITHDKEKDKLVCIGKKSGGEYMKDIFSPIERRLLLHSNANIIVVGDEV